MSTTEKQSQVLHVQGVKSFGAAEGKENERRWDDAMTDAQKQVETVQNNMLVDYNELWRYRQTNEERENRLSELTEQQDTLIEQLMNPNQRPLVLGFADALLSGEVPSSGGGGSTSDLPWDGRNRDEDEEAFRQRCLLTASRFVHRRTMNRSYRR